MQEYVSFKQKEVLLNSFVYSDFIYYLLIWHFCSSKSLYKIEKIQERTLRLLHYDFASDYAELLRKSSKATMETKRIRCHTMPIHNCE